MTIEASEALFAKARASLAPIENVEVVRGDSREVLRRIVPALPAPAVFWLDAHWSGGETYGAGDECPVLEELGIVLGAPVEHAVLIDDARLFLAPPPLPHRAEQWPDIGALLEGVLRAGPGRQVVVIEDVVAIVPARARDLLVRWAQERTTAEARANAATRLVRSARLVAEALRVIVGA
ncbi:conserved hypothetical protein [Anaeromyxobacter dehalogenans 2CP-1]|uniref:Uncharacterized protein n=1 Tax=Anaeromyxobacter dehalogenans (strain ATCC BAA-258 / DSM 21875 / 2CP-1) TaxID=455488 RepID=B8JCX9_ANAD2|nr:hypothetical protein [Anaeromyxobacter dehalogenans]ACL64007.1 conserved hypothetical protein [Anaeromyxobacter dehalogenans 2CP-1]